jgi:predicted secreted Zn-dependent protease
MSASLLAALLLQVAYQTSGTPVMASERVQTYDVAGTTSAELWDQIREHGPTDPGTGTHYAGDLRWDISSHYWLRGGAQGCSVERSEVTIETTITLPRWTNARLGSNALQTDWDVFLSRLKEHEFGHRSHAVSAAQAVREAIDGVGRSAECQALGQRIDQSVRAALEHWKQVDVDYDTTTRHGETQGAVLR